MNILDILTPKRRLGNAGEARAASYLKKNGYIILEKNFVGAGSEIDIIAEKDGVLAFVEVKTRTRGAISEKEPRPASSVTPEKQRKILNAAMHYKTYSNSTLKMRFDVIEVIRDRDERGRDTFEVKHLKDTFNADTAKRYQRKGI